MGQLEQFAKDTFALETTSATRGAAAWQLAPELNMSEVRVDGLLLMHAPARLAPLAPPWSTVRDSVPHAADAGPAPFTAADALWSPPTRRQGSLNRRDAREGTVLVAARV